MLSTGQIDFLVSETGLSSDTVEFWTGDFRDVYALCSGIELEELEREEGHDHRHDAHRLSMAQDIQAVIAPIWAGEIMPHG